MANVLVCDLLNTFFTLKHVKEKDLLWRFVGDLRNIISANNITKTIICTDTGSSKYRISKYPEYKQDRKARREAATAEEKADLQEFFEEVDKFKDIAPKLGMEVATINQVEADDLIAYFAINAEPAGYNAFVLSSDTDLFQLLRPRVVQRSYAEKMKLLDELIPPQVWVNEKRFCEVYEMTPAQYAEAKSISGDKGDSIYSPEGVGDTTGLKLIRRYGSIAEVEKNVDDLDITRFSSKGREALKENFWMVHRNYELISLLHTEEKFKTIFGEDISKLEDMVARINEPPEIDIEWLKEWMFQNGRVDVYYNLDTWVKPFIGSK